MRAFRLILAALFLVIWAFPGLAVNEPLHYFEVWRSPLGYGTGLTLNPTDGTVWACVGDSVYHYGTNHALLSKTQLWWPVTPCVDPSDGSCWVADLGAVDWRVPNQSSLVHLASDGAVVQTIPGFSYPSLATQCGPDGSVWVVDEKNREVGWRQLLRVSSAGDVVTRVSTFNGTIGNFPSPGVNPTDGTCWISVASSTLMGDDYEELIHVGLDGAVLWSGRVSPHFTEGRYLLAVDGEDGSVWEVYPTSDTSRPDLVHFSESGVVLSRTTIPNGSNAVLLDPTDGSCWANGTHVASNGSILGYAPEDGLHIDFTTGTSWAAEWADLGPNQYRQDQYPRLTHYAADGHVLSRTGEYFTGLLWDEEGRSLWAWNDRGDDPPSVQFRRPDLVRLDENGEELWRRALEEGQQWGLSADNPADGSLYSFISGTTTLRHIARDGTEQEISLHYTPVPVSPPAPTGLAVNSQDGTFWIALQDGRDSDAEIPTPAIFHLAADGTGLGRIPGVGIAPAIPSGTLAVDPADGSLWVEKVEGDGSRLTHFAADGTELWRELNPLLGFDRLSLDTADGSCWVTGGFANDDDSNREHWIRHYSKDGALLAEFQPPQAKTLGVIAADPLTGFCWYACGPYVSVFNSGGQCLWSGGGFSDPRKIALSLRDGSVWVYNWNHGQIVHLWVPVTVFPDVLYDHWAAYGVSLCYRAGLVGGYPDGYYHPELVVTRAQMAVFITRALERGDENVPAGPDTPHFPDVAADHWAYRHVEHAYANNIVKGYEDGTYAPDAAVDRGQMAVFVARALAEPHGESGLTDYTPPVTPSFPDVAEDFWAFKHIEYIKGLSVVNGYPDGKYHPEITVTRDQMAVYVMRAFQLPWD